MLHFEKRDDERCTVNIFTFSSKGSGLFGAGYMTYTFKDLLLAVQRLEKISTDENNLPPEQAHLLKKLAEIDFHIVSSALISQGLISTSQVNA